MKVSTRPVYHCSYCSKYYIHKHHAAKHETYCKSNPNNQHACFNYCKHLLKRKEDDGSEYGVKFTTFTCTKNNTELYSFIAEKRGINKKYSQFDGAIRMPLKCDLYQPQDDYMSPDEFDQIINGRNPEPDIL